MCTYMHDMTSLSLGVNAFCTLLLLLLLLLLLALLRA